MDIFTGVCGICLLQTTGKVRDILVFSCLDRSLSLTTRTMQLSHWSYFRLSLLQWSRLALLYTIINVSLFKLYFRLGCWMFILRQK